MITHAQHPTRPGPSDPMETALAYVRCRLCVIPIRPRTKVPAIKAWQHDFFATEADVRAHWEQHPEHGVGIVTGEDVGYIVLDIDPEHGGRESLAGLGPMPDTVESITGSGGAHKFFNYPPGLSIRNSAGHLGPGLDIRGGALMDGVVKGRGQVVAFPSTHPNGNRYEWLNAPWDCEMADAPPGLVSRLQPGVPPSVGSRTDTAKVPAGQRHDYLMGQAARLRRFLGYDAPMLTSALRALSQDHCEADPPIPDAEIEEIARHVAGLAANDQGVGAGLVPSSGSATYSPKELDLRAMISDGVPEVRHLISPHLPEAMRVDAVAPTGAAKSMWAFWCAAQLSREGKHVIYLSQENTAGIEARRANKLQPDFDFLHFYSHIAFDLNERAHVDWLITEAMRHEAVLIVIDTLSACWSGEENSNTEASALDSQVIRPMIGATGATVLILDHTGHPGQFTGTTRKGARAARGASAKGDKADVVLRFESAAPRTFTIHYEKTSRTGIEVPPILYEIVDTDDDLVDFIPGSPSDRALLEAVDTMLKALLASGATKDKPWTTRELRDHVSGRNEARSFALDMVAQDDRVGSGPVEWISEDGKRHRSSRGFWVVDSQEPDAPSRS